MIYGKAIFLSRIIFLFRTLAFIERGGQCQILEKKSGGESNKIYVSGCLHTPNSAPV